MKKLTFKEYVKEMLAGGPDDDWDDLGFAIAAFVCTLLIIVSG